MQKIVITILLLMFFGGFANCQKAYYPYVASSVSSDAGGNFTNALTAAFNPSLIPFIKNVQTAFYGEKKYLTDLNVFLVTVTAPFNNDGISFSFQRYGNTLYNESSISIAYGKKIGAVNAGFIFRNIRVRIHDESISLINAGIATSIKLTNDFFVSCRISNPDLFTKSGVQKLHCASSYSLILGFEASNDVYTSMEMLKDEGLPFSIIFSLQYCLSGKFICTINWSTYTNQPFASIGWHQKQLTIRTGCSYHPLLGASPAVSVMYSKSEKK